MAEYGWLGPGRERARSAFFKVLSQALATDDGREMLADSLKGIVQTPATGLQLEDSAPPYPDVGTPQTDLASAPQFAPVFISGRFRSGSTLLWNIFRQTPGCTSYYEPLNERRWFDPAARGERVDATHLGVEEYWREYQGLESLGRWFRADWNGRNLFMTERFWDPDLLAYCQGLITAAPGRAVLQFNRVDFRLPWLRHNFPQARIIHLFRHPRDQWCSSLVDMKSFPSTGRMAEFESHDHFYLLGWARDLSRHFEFLDPREAEHPYDLFYSIWKLSYLFGRTYGHASFCFETLCQSPDVELPRLMQAATVDGYDLESLKRIVVPQRSKWQQYADQAWFAEREARCESVLRRYLAAGGSGS
jgi:hypothetical protein